MGDISGRVIDGKYRLVRKLGEGGMGAVYEARHTRITRTVAVKVLTSAVSENEMASQRFLREAQAASAINHPNIVEIFDFGEDDDGSHYMVMELLQGLSLTEYIRHQGQVPPAHAVSLTIQLLTGLQAAHAMGVIHRDLKPDNIFLVKTQDGRKRLKILDFGISKVAEEMSDGTLTRTGTVMGTPVYMSPEQARGAKDIDSRTDIWAAGVILYQMLCGQQPYRGDSYNEILSKILIDPVPPLHESVEGLPDRLVGIVESTLEKDRDIRCPDCASFLKDLQELKDELTEIEASWEAESLMATLAPAESGEVLQVAYGTDPTLQVDESPGARRGGDAGSGATPPESEIHAMVDTAAAEGRTVDVGESTTLGDHPEAGLEPTLPASARGEPTEAGVSTVITEAPAWKRILWYLLTLPLAWIMMLIPPDYVRAGGSSIFGVPEGAPLGVFYGLFGALCLGLTVAIVLGERMWMRREFNRWLHGRGFMVFPLLGLLATLRCHSVLSARVDTALASFHSYASIGRRQAEEVLQVLSAALAQYLNTAALLMSLLVILTFVLLLGYTFARPSGPADRSPASRRRWLVLLGGGAIFLSAEFLLLDGVFKELHWIWRVMLYGFWFLTAIPTIRERSPSVRSYNLGWRAIVAGAIAMIAICMLTGTVGLVGLYNALDTIPPDRRAELANKGGWLVGRALGAMQGTAGVALILLVAVNWRWLGGTGHHGWKTIVRGVGSALLMLIVTATPYVALVAGNIEAGNAIKIPLGSPGIVEMSPGILEQEDEASFYVDKKASSLGKSREQFFVRLTGEDAEDFTEEGLLAALPGSGECRDILAGAITRPAEGEEAQPAVCISGVEARLYCEARDKRLPTPGEWEATVGLLGLEEIREDGSLSRGGFGEWTMKTVHGTATFEVKGLPAGKEQLAGSSPDSFSRLIGFRCAYTFD